MALPETHYLLPICTRGILDFKEGCWRLIRALYLLLWSNAELCLTLLAGYFVDGGWARIDCRSRDGSADARHVQVFLVKHEPQHQGVLVQGSELSQTRFDSDAHLLVFDDDGADNCFGQLMLDEQLEFAIVTLEQRLKVLNHVSQLDLSIG